MIKLEIGEALGVTCWTQFDMTLSLSPEQPFADLPRSAWESG
jgi:hypothetical protein